MNKSVEEILVFPTSLFKELGYFHGFSPDVERFIQPITDAARFVPRPPAEEDPSLKQIIPYVMIRHRDHIFRYKRTRRGEEERLHTKYSVGVGGHINPFDKFDLFAATKSVIEMGMEREVAEEVIIGIPYTAQCVGLLNDDSNDVGKVHFGIVYQLDVAEPKVEIRERGAFTQGSFVRADDLRRDFDFFETWSQILIESYVSKS
ncbi:MAG: phosphoesterase [Gemmatimonadota bacterium]|nr:MAG: phosphoesterase [Gemmatimonadota bacterium]